jgi:hypothetical protein
MDPHNQVLEPEKLLFAPKNSADHGHADRYQGRHNYCGGIIVVISGHITHFHPLNLTSSENCRLFGQRDCASKTIYGPAASITLNFAETMSHCDEAPLAEQCITDCQERRAALSAMFD